MRGFHWRQRLVGSTISFLLWTWVAPAEARYAAMVIDANSGMVSHAVNINTRNYPASLTKLMTLYLLFEALDQKKLSLETRLNISVRAVRQPASRLGLRAGSSIKVRTAILALIIKSANDVAMVVAEALGRTERRFALLMTAKARKLGMSRTTFRNASGLPHRGQLSTAHDIGILSKAIIKRYPHRYYLFSHSTFRYQGTTYKTHNKVLTSYPGADGMKTGYIRASGYNLVTSAQRGNQRMIGVIFGGKTPRARDRLMKRLLDKGFAKSESHIVNQTSAASRKAKPLRHKPLTSGATEQNKKDIWGIQVGAFYTRRPASTLASNVLKKYTRYLEGGYVEITPLPKRRNRVLYRARILGITKERAYHACRELVSHKHDCMELKVRRTVELAAR
ncbi:MAG: D-alanyl-D-alanine carboxypeptidase family protein [Pseudomonadota bacterium]|nr:D-alanyl-D-alanine carboxypeptidase family protein [Pseudomonadota bacterium]